MFRTDGDANVANMFNEGDPTVPRLPTQLQATWFNDVQENLCEAIENAGITLVKGTYTQLRDALVNIKTNQTIAGVKSFLDTLAGEVVNITNLGTGIAAKLAGSGTSLAAAVLDLTNNSTGPVLNGVGNAGGSMAKLKNFGNGPCLELEALNGHWPLKLAALTTLPSLNPAGGALSAADDGAVVYLAGAYNMLYVWGNGTWHACW